VNSSKIVSGFLPFFVNDTETRQISALAIWDPASRRPATDQIDEFWRNTRNILCKQGFKRRKARLCQPGSYSEGQLKERSEGGQAQWQTTLGEVMAAGS